MTSSRNDQEICKCCGEGVARLQADVYLQCDHCRSDYAGGREIHAARSLLASYRGGLIAQEGGKAGSGDSAQVHESVDDRIADLWVMACNTCLTHHRESGGVHPMIHEEFARLLIDRCVEVVLAAKPGLIQVPGEVAADMISKNVKAYFGVNE